MNLLLPLLLLLMLLQSAHAQVSLDRTLRLHRTMQPIRLDGTLDEAVWQSPDPAADFTRYFPVDTGLSRWPTEIRVAADERFLYIAATCWQRREDYTVQSLKRDFLPGTSDALNILISPSKDGLNGFLFGVSPLNVQREGLIDNGATVTYEWDNKWASAVQNYPDRWTVEIAIPFKTLRYKVSPGENTWHLNIVRVKVKDFEISSWRPIPRQYPSSNLAFVGDLVWEQAPPRPGANVAIIPYAIASYETANNRDPASQNVLSRTDDWAGNAGGDVKIGITPALNLDLTINPDFSQVEVDRQVANLSRFELFFPERRQFFLENRDLFAMYGFPDTRPFFSRRIGLAFNPVRGVNEKVPILAGARLSGKLTDDWRLGLLNMQTARVDWDSTNTLPAANFTVATVQKRVFGRSAMSAVFVDKENFLGPLSEVQKGDALPWNRVAGLEFNLYSRDNRWEGEWYYHRSFSPDPARRGQTLAHFLGFQERGFSFRTGYMMVDSNYTASAGFVPRTGVQNFFPGIGLRFYPRHKFINSWGIDLDGTLTYSLKFKATDRDLSLTISTETKDQTMLSVGIFNNYTFLFEDFDPTNLYEAGTIPLPAGRGYSYSGMGCSFTSSSSYNLQASVDLRGGEFFNGHILSAGGEISYRWQPVGTFALGYSYNRIRLPAPHASADLWLLGPRAELSFSRNVFASAFFQWNTQDNNFNINTRLQWRFAPVSDLFLVYTDNSFAEHIPNTPARFFTPKNRAVVLKVVYWLNV